MAITPDPTQKPRTSICSGCGKTLGPNDQMIWFDAMADKSTLALGNCCADRVIGALIQDFAKALNKHSPTWPSHWITQGQRWRVEAVARAAGDISREYIEAIEGLGYLHKGAKT